MTDTRICTRVNGTRSKKRKNRCKRVALSTSSFCQQCLDYSRRSYLRRLSLQKENNICGGCNSRKSEPMKSRCERCIIKDRTNRIVSTETRKAEGLCVDCVVEKSEPSKFRCKYCLKVARDKTAFLRKNSG